jgi:hypothetical protein
MPTRDAGLLIESPVSVAKENDDIFNLTLTAEPDELPPVILVESFGLLTIPLKQ